MEVQLKKTKISKSILSQTVRCSDIDLNIGAVLGWCIFKSTKYIVLYRHDINQLSKFPYFKDIEFGDNYHDTLSINKISSHWVKIKLYGNYVPLNYNCKTTEEMNIFISSLNQIKLKAETLGQFYI